VSGEEYGELSSKGIFDTKIIKEDKATGEDHS
jgi:hypothetical protein